MEEGLIVKNFHLNEKAMCIKCAVLNNKCFICGKDIKEEEYYRQELSKKYASERRIDFEKRWAYMIEWKKKLDSGGQA
jgi:hypothetical protein